MRNKSILPYLIIAFALSSSVLVNSLDFKAVEKKTEKAPSDWFLIQRSFPYPEINYDARDNAYEQSLSIPAVSGSRGEGWVLEGPYNIGGRISAVAMTATAPITIYAGAASGGIFKSTDGGESWIPVFEDALSLSIGDIANAPSNPEIIWVGTGEANAGGGSMTYDGFGIYKSDDAGNTWQHAGLENCGSVGRLAVHPQNPDVCYVAAMGRLFSNNPERGIFKTADGGATWERMLYVNDSVGGIDIVMHPDHPDTIYAAMWERIRRNNKRDYGGPGSGIYRSYDGGENWTRLAGGLPAASQSVGRIGIDISASDPNVLYAIYADNIGYFDGVYKSNDNGNSWVRTNDAALADCYASYGWWFGRIAVDPFNSDAAYVIGFDLYKTSNGGNSWSMVSSDVHVDQHDLAFTAAYPSFVVLGNDGGIYLSDDSGSSWTFLENLPITQFYSCEIDEQFPQRLYGGTQDNGTNRTLAGGTDDWLNIYWGDGFHVLVDPSDNNYVYAEYQYGNFARSTNGGTYFTTAMSGISSSDRKNWNTPFVFDPNNPQTLYYGANRLYKTTNRAQSWQAISSDLTNGNPGINSVYGTITTIAVAPSNSSFIYVGTDDGNVWMTTDAGTNWNKISGELPLRWITRVAVDPADEEIVYATLSGYRYDSYQPHVFRSHDAGETWADISGNLPEAPANDIIVDPALDSTLYLATDFGVYVTRDLGLYWQMLGDKLPNVPFVDLDFHPETRVLVAATYGRSMYSFDLDQLVSIPDVKTAFNEVFLYPNPVINTLYFDLKLTEKMKYTIHDAAGKEMIKGVLPGGTTNHAIHLSGLPGGNYILKIYSDQERFSKKFIKK
jgi:photosystem II stability/assembly factor-like uncharacterized protein